MKKLTGILMAVCLTAALIAGCGQKAGGENTQTTDNQSAAQTAGNQRETGDLSGDEVSAAQHCILLAGKNGTWLLADRDNGIMLESYPGQYPGVSKMVVTGEGTADEVKQYQDVIDMVFC